MKTPNLIQTRLKVGIYKLKVLAGSNYGGYTSGSKGLVAIFTGSGVVEGEDSNW